MQPLGAVPGAGYDLNGSATLTAPQPMPHPGWSAQNSGWSAQHPGWAGQPQNPGWAGQPLNRTEAQRQQAAVYLQQCYQWLEQAVQVMPQIADLVPPLVVAVQQYEAQQYDACLASVVAVIQTVRQVRLSVPALPPL